MTYVVLCNEEPGSMTESKVDAVTYVYASTTSTYNNRLQSNLQRYSPHTLKTCLPHTVSSPPCLGLTAVYSNPGAHIAIHGTECRR